MRGVFGSVDQGQHGTTEERTGRGPQEPQAARDEHRLPREPPVGSQVGDEVAPEPRVDRHPERQNRLRCGNEEVGERREVAERRRPEVALDDIARYVDGEAGDARDAPQWKRDPYEASQRSRLQGRPKAREPDGSGQVVGRQQAPPAEGHREGCEDDVSGQPEDETDCQHADDALQEHRVRYPPQVLGLLQQPEHDVTHGFEGLGERHHQDQIEEVAPVTEDERQDGNGCHAEHGADEPHGQIDAERIVTARVGRLQQPQVEAGQGDDGRRQGEPERKPPDVGGRSELGDADEDAPLAGAVAEIASEGPRHVAPKRRRVCGFR